MKIRIVLIIIPILIINSSLLIAQPGWIQNYDPFAEPLFDTSYEVGNILLTEEGDFVVNGTCNKFDDWDTYQFGYLMKTDSEGNVIWATIDTVSIDPYLYNGDQATMALLPDAGYVTAGEIGFDPSYLLFRDNNGIILDEKLYYGINYYSMCIGQDNNSLIITGAAAGGALLQKTDLEGNEIWRRTHPELNAAESVIRTSDGGYALGGYYDDDDFVLAKTDSDGILQWYNSYDYNSQMEWLNSIIQTSDDGYLLCGRTSLQGGTDPNGFLIKTNAVGDTLWTKKYDYNYCRWCATVIEIDTGYTIFGISNNRNSSIFNLSQTGETIWYEEVALDYNTYSEISYQKTSDDGYICYVKNWDWQVGGFGLIKTDEYGFVPILNNTITKIDNSILSCFPNPFNPSTTISYNLPDNIEKPIIEIYNIRGQKIRTFNCHPELFEGQSSIIWDGTDQYRKNVSSGIYFYKLSAGKSSVMKKMLLLK
jgi:hypothetical protein